MHVAAHVVVAVAGVASAVVFWNEVLQRVMGVARRRPPASMSPVSVQILMVTFGIMVAHECRSPDLAGATVWWLLASAWMLQTWEEPLVWLPEPLLGQWVSGTHHGTHHVTHHGTRHGWWDRCCRRSPAARKSAVPSGWPPPRVGAATPEALPTMNWEFLCLTGALVAGCQQSTFVIGVSMAIVVAADAFVLAKRYM